jgi:hypothetical protein
LRAAKEAEAAEERIKHKYADVCGRMRTYADVCLRSERAAKEAEAEEERKRKAAAGRYSVYWLY